MADQVSADFVAGQLVGIEKLIQAQADAAEKRFDRVDLRLDQQDEQHVRDREEAIRARDAKHEENQREIRKLADAIDSTSTIARDNKRWIDEDGRPLATRVNTLETTDLVKRSHAAGAAAVWGSIGAGVTLLVTIL